MQIITSAQLDSTLQSFVNNLVSIYPFAGYCLMDLYTKGFRYNELYNRSNILLPDSTHYKILTEKGSNPRTFLRSEFTNFWNAELTIDTTAFINCRLSTMQRLFDRYYHYKNTKVGTKGIKTHLFRHNRVKQMILQGKTLQQVANYFGEVNVQNIKDYNNSIITGD
jgi:hypothetical protein